MAFILKVIFFLMLFRALRSVWRSIVIANSNRSADLHSNSASRESAGPQVFEAEFREIKDEE